MSGEHDDCIYREMVEKVRALLDAPMDDHAYYGFITLGEAMADGWGDEDITALYAAVGIKWPA